MEGGPEALSQNERAYRRLKDDIVALRLKPGDALNEAGLCAEFGIGRTPVNKALHRLMHEGWCGSCRARGCWCSRSRWTSSPT